MHSCHTHNASQLTHTVTQLLFSARNAFCDSNECCLLFHSFILFCCYRPSCIVPMLVIQPKLTTIIHHFLLFLHTTNQTNCYRCQSGSSFACKQREKTINIENKNNTEMRYFYFNCFICNVSAFITRLISVQSDVLKLILCL